MKTYEVLYVGFRFVVDLTDGEKIALEADGAIITEVKA